MGWEEPTETTIDHAERATQLSETSDLLPAGNSQVAVILAKAQVEATLAVAKQLRIANIIAAIDATYANGSAAISEINDQLHGEVADGLLS
jgi:hypothetical protein